MDVADSFSVRDRVCVVTGASSGLGERFARVLAANGAQVVAVARRMDRLEASSAELPNVVAVQADLSLDEQRSSLIAAVVEQFGRIDVLVNNAGYGKPVPAVSEAMEDFRAVDELNLMAVFDLARLSARVMIERRPGSIINIASIRGMVSSLPVPNASYSASKGGVINLTRELRCQWAKHGVRVNAMEPGFFPAESTEGMVGGTPASDFVLTKPDAPVRRAARARRCADVPGHGRLHLLHRPGADRRRRVDGARAVVLGARGRHFVAGADLGWLNELRGDGSGGRAWPLLPPAEQPGLRGDVPVENGPCVARNLAEPELHPAPYYGQHTGDICRRLFGLDDAVTDDLVARGVLDELSARDAAALGTR